MKHWIVLHFAIPCCLLILSGPLSRGQVSRRDLEEIERHRREEVTPPLIQSIEGPDSLRWVGSVIVGTWDHLEEEVHEDDASDGRLGEKGLDGYMLDSIMDMFVQGRNSLLDGMISGYITRHRRGMGIVLGRYVAYEDELRAVFKSRRLPEDLSLLAAVESAMNPLALSKAGAKGMWQFMPGTARHYGLRCDGLIDERLDYYRSTDAAARYLENAYKRFGDWGLAVMSYNCGHAAIEKAIRIAGSSEFKDIYPFLPAETRGYLPAFAATLCCFRFADDLEIDIRPFHRVREERFIIDRDLTFKEISRATGVPIDELRRLNPQFLSGVIPGSVKTYILRLPARYGKYYRDNIDIVDK